MPAPILASPPPRVPGPVKPRKKGPPQGLHIHTPAHNSSSPAVLALPTEDSSAATSSALTSATTDDSDSFQFPPPPASKRSRNMKKLSLSISSAQSSTSSLVIPAPEPPRSAVPDPSDRPRRLSAVSLPVPSTTAALLRKDEDGGSPSAPYVDGPIEILPKLWLGSEDNARNWPMLVERGIGSVLNVAREVVSPLDSAASRPLRPIASTPNLKGQQRRSTDTYYPAHKLSGRPGMHYLKLQWSHGQSDLVQTGFTDAMAFVDQALERGEGILVHCQLGISRSATLVIALVMRAAATRAPSVPADVWELKGMQAAYSYVKSKSKWVGPNMSLIYQLLDYERTLRGDNGSSPTSEEISDSAAQDEEWGRRRQMMDEATSESEAEQESVEVQREARALDKAMEDRMLARKSSSSSVGSGLGMGAAWRSRYARKRAGSFASNVTSNSAISEDLVEEDEEQELLGVGGGFDGTSVSTATSTSTSTSAVEEQDRSTGESSENSGDDNDDGGDGAQFATPMAARVQFGARPLAPPPAFKVKKLTGASPSAPAHRLSFGLPPPSATKSSFDSPPVPATASRASFILPPPPVTATESSFAAAALRIRPAPLSKSRRKPPSLGVLPTVPDSPLHNIVIEQPAIVEEATATTATPQAAARMRRDSRKPSLPPLHLRHTAKPSTGSSSSTSSRSVSSTSTASTRSAASRLSQNQGSLATPSSSQTLFVFPPSPTTATTARTPSAMTLTSTSAVPFPAMTMLSTPRAAQSKRRSLIGMLAPPTPTTGHSRVDARGWIGK